MKNYCLEKQFFAKPGVFIFYSFWFYQKLLVQKITNDVLWLIWCDKNQYDDKTWKLKQTYGIERYIPSRIILLIIYFSTTIEIPNSFHLFFLTYIYDFSLFHFKGSHSSDIKTQIRIKFQVYCVSDISNIVIVSFILDRKL